MVVAKNGRLCPMCEYLTEEAASSCGLKKGWYTEDSGKLGKLGKLIPCDHAIPDGHEEVLNSAISYHEELVRDLKRRRKLTIRAKQYSEKQQEKHHVKK